MKVTITEVSPIKRDLEVTLSAEEVEEELAQAYAKIGERAHLKGFRKGKVPRAVLEQSYREEAESDTVRGLVQKSYPEVIREAGLHPVGSPEVTVTAFAPGQGLDYRASVEIPPVIEVKGYQAMNLTRDKVEVTDGEVEENLKGLQERMTQLIPVAESRKARTGDVVTIHFKGHLGEKPVPGFEAKDYAVELGKGALFTELESGLLEMVSGEKKRIGVTYPPDWSDKNLAGRKVEIEIDLKEIKEKKVPELTEDFAKDLGNFGSLEEVRSKIRGEIAKEKEQSGRNKLRRTVTEKLIGENPFEVPETMVRAELEGMFRHLEGNLKAQGITLEQAGLNRDDFFQKNRDEALFRVKGMLLFDAVAQKENLGVTEEEVDLRIAEMARLAGQPPDVWKRYYREKNLLFQVEGAIREEKTLDFVLAQSKIKIKEL